MDKAATAVGPSFRCDDCGRSAARTTPVQLAELGWKLLRPRDAYGNPVLWWRCPRCTRELGLSPTARSLSSRPPQSRSFTRKH